MLMVLGAGIEHARLLRSQVFETCVSTNSTTPAMWTLYGLHLKGDVSSFSIFPSFVELLTKLILTCFLRPQRALQRFTEGRIFLLYYHLSC